MDFDLYPVFYMWKTTNRMVNSRKERLNSML